MDHIRIIRRAFDIVRRYPVLWIFGFLLALTTSRGNSGTQYNFSNRDFEPGGDFHFPSISPEVINAVIGIIIAVVCMLVLLGIALTIVRYVALTASIRMVNQYEESGEKMSFGQGWRLGWTRTAFRIWLVDLLFGVGAFLVIILLFLLAAAPLLLLLTGSDVADVVGIVMTIGLGVFVFLLLILLAAAITLLNQFIYRAVALEDLGVFDAIRRGWKLVRSRLGDVIIMGLILFGIGLLFGILMIPIVLVLLALGALAGGLPGLLAGLITNLFVQGGPIPWVVGVMVGLPIFILVLSIPLSIVSGFFEIFNSSTWTLTYREVTALESAREETA